MIIVFASCEKIIDVKINDSDPQIVIEGAMNTDTSVYSIFVKTTVPYNSSENSFVNNATVVLTDDFGLSENLTFVGNGEYQTSNLSGLVGHTYTVSVTHEGVNYSNLSKIKAPVSLDSITTTFIPANTVPGVDEGTYLRVYYTDPVGLGDRYRMVITINDVVYNTADDYYLYDDQFADGLQDISAFYGDRFMLNPGDRVKVEFWTLDEHVHEYYETLQSIISNGFQPSGVPDNPNSTWTNGALGFFNAYSYDVDSLVVQ